MFSGHEQTTRKCSIFDFTKGWEERSTGREPLWELVKGKYTVDTLSICTVSLIDYSNFISNHVK